MGNHSEKFAESGIKIVIILEPAIFHKKKNILSKISAEMPHIIWEFLPAYSPDYNLIKLVWHSEDRIYSASTIWVSRRIVEIATYIIKRRRNGY